MISCKKTVSFTIFTGNGGYFLHNNSKENQLIAGTMFAFMVSGAGSLALGSLIPFLRESYNLSYDFAGMLVSLQSVGNLIAIGLMGFMPTFLGRRKSILITSVWMTVAYAIFTFGWGGAIALPIACCVLGVAKGANANFANTMMSTLPGKRATVGYNLAHGSYAVGALLSPLLIITFSSINSSGWRIAASAILALSVFQWMNYLLIPLPPEKIEKSVKAIDRSFLKNHSFWLASGILFFYVSTEYAITGWLVTYFQDIGVLSDNLSQLMSSLLWLVMFTGRMVGAMIVSKISRKILLLVDGIGLLVFFLIVFFSRSQTPIIFSIAGVGLFMATIYTSAMALGTESVRGNDLGVSAMTFAGSAGGIITPAAVGFIAEKSGIQAGMGVVVGTTVLLLIMILVSTLSPNAKE